MSENIGVYKAIVSVQKALAKEGIAKDRQCTQGASYKFRGIDDIYNALAPFLASASLCILPRMIARNCVERTSAKGNALFYTTVEAEFDFVSAEDGSQHTVRTFGEAMDSGDKGTNKAMSAAYKYAAFQAFCIPTEGDNDSENQTHEVKPGNQQQRPQQQPGRNLEWYKKSSRDECKTPDELTAWWKDHAADIGKLSPADQKAITAHCAALKKGMADKQSSGPATVDCPLGGKVVREVECAECDKAEKCEHGKR